jgi:aryl-alcohol dehydrogenase-like predicted oxidoreductase
LERELLPFCAAYGAGIIPYSPLAGGFLTGKYRRGEEAPEGTRLAGNARAQERWFTARNFEILERLGGFAVDREHTLGELAISWLLGHPEVSTVIAGATTPEQVEANARAADWELSPDEMEAVNDLLSARD